MNINAHATVAASRSRILTSGCRIAIPIVALACLLPRSFQDALPIGTHQAHAEANISFHVKNFTAVEIPSLTGKDDSTLVVSGEVEVRKASDQPILSRHVPQGFNQFDLLLDLSANDAGIGAEVLTWKPVKYSEPVGGHHFKTVTILGGDPAQSIPVKQAKS